MDEILFLAVLSVLFKLLEDCHKIALSRSGGGRLKNVHGLYEAFNAHLPISLSVFAFLISRGISQDYVYCSLVIVVLGVSSKGVFSYHKPDRLVWADSDARWGLIIPNGCAIAAIVVAICATHPSTSTITGQTGAPPVAQTNAISAPLKK